MTIKGLIKILSYYDPDREVVVDEEDKYETRYDIDFSKFAVIIIVPNDIDKDNSHPSCSSIDVEH